MIKFISAFISTMSSLTIFAQYKMRTVDQLINRAQPGWTVLNSGLTLRKVRLRFFQRNLI